LQELNYHCIIYIKITIIKGNRQSLGYKRSDVNFPFTNHTIEVGMACYLSTDGFLDQLGGYHKQRCGFGRKRFKNLLLENYHYSFDKQSEQILQTFNKYQGDNDRQDDML